MDPLRIERYVDAAAAALDLPLDPMHRPGVLAYFALAAELAALVGAVELGVRDEAAPVFTPIGPDDAAARESPPATTIEAAAAPPSNSAPRP